MRNVWILCIAALMFSGCNKKEADVNPELPKDKAKSQAVSGLDSGKIKTAGDKTGQPAGAGSIDPALKGLAYPAAAFDGTFTTGNIVSASYFSTDEFSKVVDFYNQKFPGTPIQPGTTRHFSKNSADGNHVSATLSQVGDKTQIILKLEKKG